MADVSSSNLSKESEEALLDDMTLLLDCLKFQKDSLKSQKQALSTLGIMVARGSSNVREVFRTNGFLEYIIKLIRETESMELIQAGLCTLGCAADKDINTQIRLSNAEFFTLLNAILRSKETSQLLKSTVVLLLINVINSNIQGQKMTQETKILCKLIDIFKTCIPSTSDMDNEMMVDYWRNVAKCISCACDNPQNELNQNQCTSTFPIAVSILQSAATNDSNTTELLIRPVLILLTSCVANNERAQDRLHMVGGVRAFVELFNSLLCNKEEHISLIVYIIQALFAVITNNVKNTQYLVSFHIISHLLKLLTMQDLDSHQQLSIITCLVTLIESNDEHQNEFIKEQGESILIDVLSETVDESISKTIPLIIRICKRKEKERQCTTVEEGEDNDEIQQQPPPDCYIDLTREDNNDNNNIVPQEEYYITEKCQQSDDTRDLLLKELASIKLPVTTKVSQWLERAEAESSYPPTAESIINGKSLFGEEESLYSHSCFKKNPQHSNYAVKSHDKIPQQVKSHMEKNPQQAKSYAEKPQQVKSYADKITQQVKSYDEMIPQQSKSHNPTNNDKESYVSIVQKQIRNNQIQVINDNSTLLQQNTCKPREKHDFAGKAGSTYSINTSTVATAIHDRMNELEVQLSHEREKRLLIENELDLMKHTPTIVYNTTTNTAVNNSDNRDGVFKRPPIRSHKGREPLRHKHIPTPRPSYSNHQSTILQDNNQYTTSTPKCHFTPLEKPVTKNVTCSRPSSNLNAVYSRPSSGLNIPCSRPSAGSSKFPFKPPQSSSVTPSRPKGIPDRVTLFQRAKQGHISYNHFINRSSGSISLITPSVSRSKGECPGCVSTSLNSRNFLACLRSSTNTCDYHHKVIDSIVMKTPLIDVMEEEKLSYYNDSSLLVDHEEIIQTDRLPQNIIETSLISPLPSPIQYTTTTTSLQQQEKNKGNYKEVPHYEWPINSISAHSFSHKYDSPTSSVQHVTTTSRPLNPSSSCPLNRQPLQEMKISPLHLNVLKPLNYHITKSRKQSLSQQLPSTQQPVKQRVYNYDYSLPGMKKKYTNRLTITGKERQKPLYFTNEEVKLLLKGVKKVGPKWKHILNAYPFQLGRTATSLKDKYRLLSKY